MTTTPRMDTELTSCAHGVDGGAVAALLVAPADPAACGHRARLGDPDQFEGEVAVRGFASVGVMGRILPLAGR